MQELRGNTKKTGTKEDDKMSNAKEKKQARTRMPIQILSKDRRTLIAEYAVKNGYRDTIRYCKATMDIDISYSTVKSIKNKFLNKRPMVEMLEEQMKILSNKSLHCQSTS
jgi:hypothetical protein